MKNIRENREEMFTRVPEEKSIGALHGGRKKGKERNRSSFKTT